MSNQTNLVKELLEQKQNVSEQLILLRKNRHNKEVQEYIQKLESLDNLSGYMKYLISRYYYGNKDAIKYPKNCLERLHKVILRPFND